MDHLQQLMRQVPLDLPHHGFLFFNPFTHIWEAFKMDHLQQLIRQCKLYLTKGNEYHGGGVI